MADQHPGTQHPSDVPHPVPLSADSEGQLRVYAADLAEHLRARPRRLADVAHTLRVGREPRRHRAALEPHTTDDLLAGLEDLAAGRRCPRVRRAVVERRAPGDGVAAVPGDDPAALDRWLAGEPVDWSALIAPGARRVALPAQPPPAPSEEEEAAAPEPRPIPEPTREPSGNPASALGVLLDLYAKVSGIPIEELDAGVPTDHFGLTSAQVATMNARLGALSGADVPPTLFFRNPTLAGVAADLAVLPGPWHVVPASLPRPAPTAPADDGGAIAAIGLAGRYPDAADIDAFWCNLVEGRDAVRQVPADRGHPEWAAGIMWGGWLDDVASFDPGLFGITPRDAGLMDPQERIFLETTWRALEDAAYPRRRLHDRHGARVGVFAGSMYNEYPFFGVEETLRGTPTDSGSAIGGIANRVSFHLDLHGPSLTVDTMCSSSLVAVHLAVRSLRAGECEVAIAGAVNLSLHPNKFVQQRRMKLTASGLRCRSFGAGGDGFVPGEGVGVVVLKALARALADGDRVHAVICGTAASHMGRTSGWIVPNPRRQGDVVRDALADAGVAATDIGYLEAHGAGTALGDPVEIEGLMHAFGGQGLAPGSVPIGAVKSNIGHIEAAAGIAALTKVLLQLRHRTYAPSLHAETLNEGIDWDAVPFHVQRTAAPWPQPSDGGPRRAGVSSFGAGGTVAHVVVEEAPPVPPRHNGGTPGPQVVVLSAADRTRLAEAERDLLHHLEENGGGNGHAGVVEALERLARGEVPPGGPLPAGAGPAELAAALLGRGPQGTRELADVAWTTQVTREPLCERLAVVAADLAELRRELAAHLDGRPSAVLTGTARGTAPAATDAAAGPAALAAAWVAGADVDWEALHPPGERRLVPLPPYPFARVRCWLPQAASPQSRQEPGAPSTSPVPLWEQTYEPVGGGPATSPRPALTLCLHTPATEALARELAATRTCGELLLARWGNDLGDHASAVRLAGDLLARHDALEGILDLCDLGQGAPKGTRLPRVGVLQQFLVHRRGRDVRVLHATADHASADAAAVGALVVAAKAEHRRLTGTTADLDEPTAAAIAAAWAADGERLRVRAGRLEARVLRPLDAPAAAVALDPAAWYLVTGAGRGIGARVACHLAVRGARRVALLGVRALGTGAADDDRAHTARRAVEELLGAGADVRVHTGELTDAEGLTAFLVDLRREGPVRGLVHCAGRVGGEPRAIAHEGALELTAMIAPKVDAWLMLAAATAGDSLGFAVAFSSISAVCPALAAGVADYAAANAALDLLVGGGPFGAAARTVAWPMWAESGSGVGGPNVCEPVGVAALRDAEALAVLDTTLGLGRAAALVPLPPLPGTTLDVERLVGRPGSETPARPTPTATLPAGATDSVPAWLVEIVARITGTTADALHLDRDFAELGIESVMLAEVLTAVEDAVGRRLEPTLLIEHPDLRRLTTALEREGLAGPVAPTPRVREEPAPAAAPEPAPEPSAPVRHVREPVAIIGMAVRFPGARDADTLWDNLLAGRSAVTEVPPSRWDAVALHDPAGGPGRSTSKWGGFVDGIEDFDAEAFGMSRDDARDLDPAIRLVLEAAMECLDDAGYQRDELAGRRVGTVVGGRLTGYTRRADIRPTVLQADPNFIVAHLAHLLDLRGPALVVDSACSSALVAVHTACRDLAAGDAELALVAGVEVLLDERSYLEFSAARAISPTGRCATFDESADGFVPGEGCGAVLLKPLSAALADGDRIHAVIEGSAVNNDGRTMGVTTPNPVAQADVVRRALATAGRRPAEIGLVEAHGTGTVIGDPIELRALTDVFREGTGERQFCGIGSIKSGIGHLLNASGMAGLVKAMLAVERGLLPPTIHCERPNQRFDFAASPFFPVVEPTPWRPGLPRVAGTSSFGLGGTNAHVIVAQPPDDAAHPAARKPLPWRTWRRERLWHEAAGAPTVEPAPRPRCSLLDLTIRRPGDRLTAAGA